MNALTRSSWISSNGRQTLPSNNSVCRRGTFEGLTLFRCVCMYLFPLCAVLYALFSLCAVTCKLFYVLILHLVLSILNLCYSISSLLPCSSTVAFMFSRLGSLVVISFPTAYKFISTLRASHFLRVNSSHGSSMSL